MTSLVLAAPGISALFMGEEFLKDKIWSDDRSYNGLIYWAGLTTSDSTMRDFLQFTNRRPQRLWPRRARADSKRDAPGELVR